jgi:hypothetical protein
LSGEKSRKGTAGKAESGNGAVRAATDVGLCGGKFKCRSGLMC